MRKTTLIISCLLLALLSGTAVAIGLSSRPAGGSKAAALATPPGRGHEKPWWETVSVVPPTPVKPTTTYRVPGDVLFDTNSSNIDPAGRAALISLANDQLAGAKAIVVAGATDSRGIHQENVRLSEARAKAVESILVQAGVDPNIIRIEAWADDHPVADENGPDPTTAQALNRRVEIEVTK